MYLKDNERPSQTKLNIPIPLDIIDTPQKADTSGENTLAESFLKQTVFNPLTQVKPSTASANAYQRGGLRTQSPALVTFACDECNIKPIETQIVPPESEIQTQKFQEEISSTTINVIVRVTNPRLILLEDPATDESRAIVSSCGIEVHYSREHKLFHGLSKITNAQNKELRESLHVSLHDHKVFVLRNMQQWNPQSILEPMGMEFNLRRRTVNSLLLSSIMSIDMDNVNARVSINDIFLAQSIMTRKSLTEQATPILAPLQTGGQPSPGAESDPPTNASNGTEKELEGGPATSYIVSLNMGSLSLVGINDFNGQNVPVIRTLLDGTTFYAEGCQQRMQGDGSLIASADFYNPQLSVWEPILDRWHPSLSLISWTVGTSIEIKSDHTMQLTVSGIMLEKLLQTYSLFYCFDDIVDREEVPDVVINNTLGPDISFEVFDSATSVSLMTLNNNEIKAVPSLHDGGKASHRGGAGRSFFYLENPISVVDIQFLGKFGDERLPLHHLPFNINKPRTYNLQPRPLIDSVEKIEGVLVKNEVDKFRVNGKEAMKSYVAGTCSRSVVLEPIVEEVYENSRYDPITGRYTR
jgi:hypothetical protein